MVTPWNFSPTGKSRVVLTTLLGIAGSMFIARVTVSIVSLSMAEAPHQLLDTMSLIMPILLGGPICFFFAKKLMELAIAHEQLAIVASQDSLTACLNRGAFVTLTDAYLSRVDADLTPYGAMLIVDADHFKRVNDRFGHATGDTALKLIAQTIRGGLRSVDLVGRIGGEEFAVFLPRLDQAKIKDVANGICRSVSDIDFRPNGTVEPLTVSLGAVTYRGSVTYDQLFQAADKKLFDAKLLGRNRAEFGAIVGHY